MKRLIYAAAAFVLAAAVCCGVYLNMGYDASEAALAMMPQESAGGAAVFMPEEVHAGLIFYPGGLVDHAAYAPLMQALCGRGILCLLKEMPLDLAVFDIDAADGLRALYPDVDTWIIGGHSLGGAMAASYASSHAEEYDALVLLGAYSVADLSGTEMHVLSVRGTEDGVLNREKYEESRKNYPARFTEVILDGGCHAYFGDYGAQKGDGTPSMTREEQIEATADAIAALVAPDEAIGPTGNDL